MSIGGPSSHSDSIRVIMESLDKRLRCVLGASSFGCCWTSDVLGCVSVLANTLLGIDLKSFLGRCSMSVLGGISGANGFVLVVNFDLAPCWLYKNRSCSLKVEGTDGLPPVLGVLLYLSVKGLEDGKVQSNGMLELRP